MATEVPAWVKKLVASDIYKTQENLTRRAGLPAEVVAQVLAALVERGGGDLSDGAKGLSVLAAPDPAQVAGADRKAAIIAFSKHLAKQLGPDGITVNTVSPGTTLTARVAKVWDLPTQQKKAATNPLRCLVEPQDSADACLFLASNEARHITGINLNVNAGSSMV